MQVCGRALIFLLIINHSWLMTSSSQNATRPRFRPPGSTMDYYDEYEDFSTEPPSSSPTASEEPEPSLCLYDMCLEQQGTCIELALAEKCLCPGLSGPHIPPSPPRLSKVSQEDGIGVVVQWCAPTSIVTHYIVRVESKDEDKVMERKLQVEDRKRSAVLGNVAAGAHVCVEAVNKAGASEKDSQSCTTFEPQTSDSGLALKVGIIGGVVGLLVVLFLALLLWRHKKQQKSSAQRQKGTEAVL